ncbi:IS3 family transposase [Ekhidna sp.]|uniref:IS3 family transposase n=1 Tax=Ekhidna sp. TaxID=2608089 RepID=UPI003B5A5CC9
MAYLCQLLGFSRQAYYKGHQRSTDRAAFYTIVAELVTEIRARVGNQRLGSRKLLPLLNEQLSKQGMSVGRDQLFDIMDSYGLKVRRRYRRKPRTTDSTHGFRRYPNLVKSVDIKHSEHVWVSDITYVKVKDRFMYLNLITDAHSRKIMGYRLHEDLSVEGSLKALLMAIGNREYPHRKLIHHSDQGVQYCSHMYVNQLKTQGIAISMASKGSPHENALAERINGILKQEYDLCKAIDSEEKARQLVEVAVASYNTRRPHLSLQGQTPEQAHGADNWSQDEAEELSIKSSTKKVSVKTDQD